LFEPERSRTMPA